MKFKIALSILLIFSITNSFSQQIFGIDFSKDEFEIRYKLGNMGFQSVNNWQTAKGILFKKDALLSTKQTPILKDIYEYEFLIATIDDPSNIFIIYKEILDSIKSQFNLPDSLIQKNDYNFNANNIFSKLISNEIAYYAKWNKNEKRNYSIEFEVKTDANISLIIKDYSKNKTEEEEGLILDKRNREEEESRLKQQKELVSKLNKSGLGILEYSAFDVSEYTEGTGFRISVFNPTKKVIKYISISFSGYNSVNDKVINRMRTSYINSVRCVGPIKQYDDAEYEWDYIWFNDLVETIKLTSINVQYMDGSSKLITNIGNIIVAKKDRALLNNVLLDILDKPKSKN